MFQAEPAKPEPDRGRGRARGPRAATRAGPEVQMAGTNGKRLPSSCQGSGYKAEGAGRPRRRHAGLKLEERRGSSARVSFRETRERSARFERRKEREGEKERRREGEKELCLGMLPAARALLARCLLLCALSCAWPHRTRAASRLKASSSLPIQSERDALPSKGLSGKRTPTDPHGGPPLLPPLPPLLPPLPPLPPLLTLPPPR
ncbi:hypothetical protein EYF80_064072 [Liparis tanakae]|uniref:Uncharacterized protein n=1 Tax=Liparis tanakae TaxID=230148 RepID=A0A4Z2EAL4_9TELE|nr:hypothetical protein EYF80_064072 [Liparis tanakae]